jgi:ABC-type transport system involved in cytochrome bd biosynthesis fused ATPase/permease subunit
VLAVFLLGGGTAVSGGTTVVYITHRDEELAPFDDVAVVDAGRVTVGPPRRT